MSTGLLRAAFALIALLLLPLLHVSPAHGAAINGACCLANGGCQDVIVTQCDTLGGEFIGEDTSCQLIDCAAPVTAPLLSIGGLVAAFGALAALGVYRLAVGRRR